MTTELKQQAQPKHETYWAPGKQLYRCDDCDFSSQSLSEALEHQRQYALERQKLDRIRAAAPGLLETLRSAHAALHRVALTGTVQASEVDNALLRIEQAIAKATGGEQ